MPHTPALSAMGFDLPVPDDERRRLADQPAGLPVPRHTSSLAVRAGIHVKISGIVKRNRSRMRAGAGAWRSRTERRPGAGKCRISQSGKHGDRRLNERSWNGDSTGDGGRRAVARGPIRRPTGTLTNDCAEIRKLFSQEASLSTDTLARYGRAWTRSHLQDGDVGRAVGPCGPRP